MSLELDKKGPFLMPDGLSMLEKRIEEFNQALADMKEATSEAHAVLKQIRDERRAIEKLFKADDVAKQVQTRVDEVIKTKLGEIGPGIDQQTNRIYQKVGEQIDKVIDISMGEEFAKEHNRLSIRPALAAKLREWLREVIDQEGYALYAKDLEEKNGKH